MTDSEPLHPAQILAMAQKLNARFPLMEDLLTVEDLCRRLDEVHPLAEQGDEEAQLVFQVLIKEFRRRANEYDRFLHPEEDEESF